MGVHKSTLNYDGLNFHVYKQHYQHESTKRSRKRYHKGAIVKRGHPPFGEFSYKATSYRSQRSKPEEYCHFPSTRLTHTGRSSVALSFPMLSVLVAKDCDASTVAMGQLALPVARA